ncbi:MAG: rod shape-determining protein RodA [Chloroflexia bacterium]|nr:rod shape-determining protein RodA [Chloroflexia bacterium]
MEQVRWRNFDFALLVSTLILALFGLAMIHSATMGTDLGGFSLSGLPMRQLIALLAGLVLIALLSSMDYRYLAYVRWVLYLLNLGMLALVFFVGKQTYGATRWIDLGVFDLQPSELAKPLLVITLGCFLAQRQERAERLSTFLLSILHVLPPTVLVFLQPDLSTAMVLLAIWLGMVWIGGVRPAYLLTLLFLSIPAGVLAWRYLLADYQKVRLLLFLDPYQDLWGGGYNILQAWTAIGAGGWLGKGFGQGTQSQLHFLPVRHSDFIFAVICEELGFWGASALLLMLLLFVWQILRVGQRAGDSLGRLLATGVAAGLAFQCLVNIGMNVGVMPVTGLPLPLISSGGSSILFTLLSLGLVQSVSVYRRRSTFEPLS